jgi:3-oxoacyl-[acyl-carrier protein] reductase
MATREDAMGFLDGQVAVVTGGNRGIGRGIVEALAREGARVALTARERARAEQAAREVGAGALGLACDVRDPVQVARMFQEVERAAGGVDVLVNNAGIGLFAPVADMRPEDWDAVIGTNLSGVFYCCHEAIPRMRKRGGGYIFNISSLAGKNPVLHGAAYNASKFGLNGFSEALLMEVRYDGIRVSYLMPGSVATEFGADTPERAARTSSKSGWALTPADVGEVVLDLLRSPRHAMYSRVEMRPSQPPRRG